MTSLLAFGLITKEPVCLKRLQYDSFRDCMCFGPYRSSLLCSGPASIITWNMHFSSCTFTHTFTFPDACARGLI